MTLEERIARIDRADERSLTTQLVELFLDAIASGELAPGARLPPTRGLAALAGINQLTAGRVYRRLQTVGAVVSEVGRGTFVRAAAAATHVERPGDASWQSYVLEPERNDESDRIIGEIARHVEDPSMIALSAGYPALELIPLAALREAAVEAIERHGARAFQYGPIEGDSELRAELAELGRRRGLDDDANSIVATTGPTRPSRWRRARRCAPATRWPASRRPSWASSSRCARSARRSSRCRSTSTGLTPGRSSSCCATTRSGCSPPSRGCTTPPASTSQPPAAQRLVELARQHGFFILEDGVYADLRFEGDDPGPLRALAPSHVIYVDSLSKTVGPGLRAGWIAASGPVLDRIIGEKRRDDAHGTHADPAAHRRLPRARACIRRSSRARSRATARAATCWSPRSRANWATMAQFARPAGGGHVWVTLRQPLDDARLYREALAGGVTFVPGAAMLVERPRATHLRLSYGLPDPASIGEGVRRLAQAIRVVGREAPAQRRSLPVT